MDGQMLGRITQSAVPEQGGLSIGEQGCQQATRGPALRPRRHGLGVRGEGTKIESGEEKQREREASFG